MRDFPRRVECSFSSEGKGVARCAGDDLAGSREGARWLHQLALFDFNTFAEHSIIKKRPKRHFEERHIFKELLITTWSRRRSLIDERPIDGRPLQEGARINEAYHALIK